MELTLSKVLCGENLDNENVVIESIRRLKDFCWDVAIKIREGTAGVEDAIRGIAFSRDLAMLLTYYQIRELTGLDEADLFLATEAAQAAMELSVNYVRTHID
jgi:hypothetical protein